jgi:hypothetical protein
MPAAAKMALDSMYQSLKSLKYCDLLKTQLGFCFIP